MPIKLHGAQLAQAQYENTCCLLLHNPENGLEDKGFDGNSLKGNILKRYSIEFSIKYNFTLLNCFCSVVRLFS